MMKAKGFTLYVNFPEHITRNYYPFIDAKREVTAYLGKRFGNLTFTIISPVASPNYLRLDWNASNQVDVLPFEADPLIIESKIRAAIEVREILTHQTITFPLKERDFLLQVKKGELDYLKVVAPYLESLMEEVEELSLKSKLPLKVERKFWEDFLFSTYHTDFLNFPFSDMGLYGCCENHPGRVH